MGDVVTIPDGEFPDDYNKKGHFLLIGETESGKSYYAKWLVYNLAKAYGTAPDGEKPIYVYAGGHAAYQWTQPEETGVQVAPPSHVFTDWDIAQVNQITEDIGTAGGGAIVFDDFLGTINFHHNTNFEGLFKYIRHKGGKVLVITHSPADVPPAVRNNVSNIIVAYSDSVALIRDLAQNYLGNDSIRLKTAMQSVQAEYTMVKIRKGRTAGGGTLALHRAGPIGEATDDIPIGQGINLGISAQARGDVSVGGHYNDHSTNQQFLRLEQDIKIQQQSNQLAIENLHARSRARMDIEKEQSFHEDEMRRLRERHEARRLAYATYVSTEERDTIARVVGEGLSERRVTPYNVFSGGFLKEWMDMYYPGDNYVDRERGGAALATFGGNIGDIAAGNKIGLFAEALRFGASTGIGARLFGGRRETGPSRAELQAKKRRQLRPLVRDIILAGNYKTADSKADLVKMLNALRGGRDVTATNLAPVMVDFLRRYYPVDHAAMLARATASLAPSPSTPSPTDRSAQLRLPAPEPRP